MHMLPFPMDAIQHATQTASGALLSELISMVAAHKRARTNTLRAPVLLMVIVAHLYSFTMYIADVGAAPGRLPLPQVGKLNQGRLRAGN
jgi:hypothetical protein